MFGAVVVMALRACGLAAYLGELSTGAAVLARAERLPAGVAVLDLDVGRDADGRPVSGVNLIKALRARGRTVLVLSDRADEDKVAAAIAAGAVGSVAKASPLAELLAMVGTVAAGGAVMSASQHHAWLARHWACQTRQREWSRRLDRLSKREREVLTLLVEGYRASAIAEHFVVSMTTVRTQIRSILAKLDVNSQLEAVALAAHILPTNSDPVLSR